MQNVNDKIDAELKFTRRTILLGSLNLSLFGIALGRLYYIGGYKHSTYKTLSDANRIKVQYILPKRGKIFDRNGIILASNFPCYRLMILPNTPSKINIICKKLQNSFSLTDMEIFKALNQAKKQPQFMPIIIKNNLKWAEVCKLEVILRDFLEFFIDVLWVREYPYSEDFSHIIGYVQTIDKNTEYNRFAIIKEIKVGKFGIEKLFDYDLRGVPGFKRIEVNSNGQNIRQLEYKKSKSGGEIHLTIDKEVQQYAQQALSKYESGSCAVINIKNGEVLSLNSHPSFDSNLFIDGINQQSWNELQNNPYGCLNNKAISGLYAPGSAFKIVVAIAAFESGAIDSSFTSSCRGYIMIGKQKYHCWHRWGGHGSVDFFAALAQSCDIYFYKLAHKLGAKKIQETAKILGFGKITGIEIPNEKSGLVPESSWMQSILGKKWQLGDTINLGIGQGALLVTPLQLALMTAKLLNKNLWQLTPTILKGKNDDRVFDSLEISKKTIQIIHQGYIESVNNKKATSYRSRINQKGFEMGGKSSTTQVKNISIAERKAGILKNSQRLWKYRDHALFTGYAPLHDPKYAIAVVIEHGGGGSTVATPIARDILTKIQQVVNGHGKWSHQKRIN